LFFFVIPTFQDEIKDNEVCGACSMYGGKEKCIEFWCGNLRTDTTWRTRHRWDDNIIMDLK
jgi:hypothetical protein